MSYNKERSESKCSGSKSHFFAVPADRDSQSDREFEIFWKAIERVEKWEVGHEDFIEKWYISGVHKKRGTIIEYCVKKRGSFIWASKEEAVKLATENRLHAIIVHMENGIAFLRPEYNLKPFEQIS